MGGLKTFGTAASLCRVFDELPAFLRPRSRRHHAFSLAQRRALHRDRFAQLMDVMAVASPESYQLTTLL
jgi:hypothetical protein